MTDIPTNVEIKPKADVQPVANDILEINAPTKVSIAVPKKSKPKEKPLEEIHLPEDDVPSDEEEESLNDCVSDEAELAREINEFHAEAEKNEIDALLNAWEAGVRLNRAYEVVPYGGWGTFLNGNCPDLGLTTVWRYRRLADGYSTLEELCGMTLSEAYAKLDLANFPGESLAEKDEGESDTSTEKKSKQKGQQLFQTVVKASKKFDTPVTLSQKEKSAVKKLCVQLEDVCAKISTPSILGLAWQGKLGKHVSEWTIAERAIFKKDYTKLQTVWEQIEQLSKPQEHEADEATYVPTESNEPITK